MVILSPNFEWLLFHVLGANLSVHLTKVAAKKISLITKIFHSSSSSNIAKYIRSICRSLPKWVMSSLVAALVLTRLDGGNATLVGLPARQLNRLQHVLHAAARLVYGARKFDYVTPLLRELHWLSVPERITFKLATLMFRCLHGTAPAYLAESFYRAADDESRRRLRSGASPALLVATTRRRTLGDRAFPVAGTRVWNSLPATLTSQSSLLTFRQQLKTLLFERSYLWLSALLYC